jgi:hypothetical protein
VDSLAAVHLALREMLGPITRQLARRGLGARELQLRPSHRSPVEKTIRLSRPSRRPADLFNLLDHATQNLQSGEGIAAVGLLVSAASWRIERQGQVQHVMTTRLHDLSDLLSGYDAQSRDFR